MKNKTKTTSCEKWLLGAGMLNILARRCSTKKLSLKLHKIHRKIPVLEPLANTAKGLHAVRLANLLKRNPGTGVLEPAVCKCSLK